MTTAFDPYFELLGITPAEQPPNLYRLLGVALIEAAPSEIEQAAELQLSHLRSMQD